MTASTVSAEKSGDFEDFSEGYFDALPDTKEERYNAVVNCANELCSAQKAVSKETLDAVVDEGRYAADLVRRTQFGVRLLNEYGLTDQLEESMVVEGRENLKRATQYLPLIGSFNRLCEAACAVEPPKPNAESVKDFLQTSLAFGIEVALWQIGAPYKMAWRGTRFIANRTFLRFARYGCRSCIALAMSELHWAIRGSVYNHGVTEDKVEFVWGGIQELQAAASKWNYEVNLDFSYKEIQETVWSEKDGIAAGPMPQEREGWLGRYLPDISIDIPSLSEILS